MQRDQERRQPAYFWQRDEREKSLRVVYGKVESAGEDAEGPLPKGWLQKSTEAIKEALERATTSLHQNKRERER